MPSLFHKKSKSHLAIRRVGINYVEPNVQNINQLQRIRAMSTSSTVSQTSTSSTRSNVYDPLACHPPLCLNSSPVISEDEEDTSPMHDGRDNSSYQYTMSTHGSSSTGGSSDYAIEDNNVSYFDWDDDEDEPRRTQSYHEEAQWPLKDFQTIPFSSPAASHESGSRQSSYSHQRPHTSSSNQRRPLRTREGQSEMEAFVARGDWKRRGIVFHLNSEAEREQAQHFEFPI